MLDDDQVLRQRDPSDALGIAGEQYAQATFEASIDHPEHDGRQILNIVFAGMGGSALAAGIAKTWLVDDLPVPLEVVRGYNLPNYVGYNTLVIASSYSGNTEEVLSVLEKARQKCAQVAVITSGGALESAADETSTALVRLPDGIPQRMTILYTLRALTGLLAHFGVMGRARFEEIASVSGWLREQTREWTADVPTDKNQAKQLALLAVGKTPVFYAGSLMAPVAYKWKISWNENAKNVAFWNEYPEFNHNEFMGWASHPVDKPFAVFDLVSNFEHPRILKRFELSDKLLSGKRPKAHAVELQGETALRQIVWSCVLADFASIYVAILNGVDPKPVALIEKLKQELS